MEKINQSINYINKGDIFKIKNVANYGHGCNCAGAMGKGIALQFKKKYPEMYLEYKDLCKKSIFNLGDIFVYKYKKGYIFNLGTQKHWRTKADIKAIIKSINSMLKFASKNNIYEIALPKIGAGLGGLKWSDVKSVLNKASEKHPEIKLFIVEEYEKELN